MGRASPGAGNAAERIGIVDGNGRSVEPDEGFGNWYARTLAVRQKGGAVYLIGNGASASMASHFAADLAKNARLHTQVFFDAALLTAISNDLGFENVFAEPLRRRAQPGDMLVAISSSGRSSNILRAVAAARKLSVVVITLSAMLPDNPLRRSGDLNAYVSAASYSRAETCHAAILHHWMDLVIADGIPADFQVSQGNQVMETWNRPPDHSPGKFAQTPLSGDLIR